jgi:LEA14-like dessication related protein
MNEEANMFQKVLLAAVLVGLTLTVVSCVQPSPPTANFLEYKIAGINPQGVEVNFFFQTENPNPLAVDITKYNYKVYINNQEFLVEDRPGFSLAANAKQLIKIPVTISFGRLYGSALQVIQALANGQTSIDYRIEGSLSAGFMGANFITPIKAAGAIPIPKDFKIQ